MKPIGGICMRFRPWLFAVLCAFIASAIVPARAAETTPEAIKARGVLRVGVKYDSPPFGQLDPRTNQVEGFDIDIARAIAKTILGDESKVDLVQVTSANRIPQLQNGNIDLIVATMTITSDRMKQIDFSNVYYRAGQSLLVRKDSPVKSYSDLAGRSVCTITGSTPEQTIRRVAPRANVVVLESYPECFTALRGGRVDALTTDNVLLFGLQQQDPANFKLTGGLFTFEPYGIGIAAGNRALTAAVNATLARIARDGSYARMHAKWLKEPPPADWRSWFGESPEKAAAQFATELTPAPAATR
jgi:aspartate/glutamate/glutamine transport system substrate-binding protein